MELPEKLYEKIETLSEEGNIFFDDDCFEAAIDKWMQALDYVPSPKSDWEATYWLCTSIGDAHYQLSRFGLAREFFFDALNGRCCITLCPAPSQRRRVAVGRLPG